MNDSSLIILGKNIHDLRKDNGLSQHELGKAVGVSGDIIGRYERGTVNPTFKTIIKISEALNCSLDELVGNKKSILPKNLQLRLQQLESLSDESKEHILVVMEAYVRDYKAKLAYGS